MTTMRSASWVERVLEREKFEVDRDGHGVLGYLVTDDSRPSQPAIIIMTANLACAECCSVPEGEAQSL